MIAELHAMTFLRTALLLLILCPSAFALPTGEWLAQFFGRVGTIKLTDATFAFHLADGESNNGFEGPLAEVKEADQSLPGRLIVGPVEGGKFPYEVVWLYEPVGPRARFFCELEGFKTLAEARATTPEFTMAEASLFLTADYFRQVDAFPPLPVPDKAQLLALLEEAVRRHKAAPEEDVNNLMETLMIERGYHPIKSREPFESAVEKFAGDPAVTALIDQMEP